MRKIVRCCLISLFLAVSLVSCTVEPEEEDPDPYVPAAKGTVDTTLTITSTILGRTVHYSVYLPPGYDTSHVSYPVLYLLHGMWGDHRDWVANGMAAEMNYAFKTDKALPMVVIMPQGYNAFYCNNYNNEGLMYEDFMVNEFFPYIEAHYRIKTNGGNTAIAGLSMGGYGCTYYAFKYQQEFSSAYAMSAAVPNVTGAPDIREILNSKTAEELDNLPAYAMEVGTEDFVVLGGNVTFDAFLTDKGIYHTYITRAGTHDWTFWMTCLPKAIEFVSSYFSDYP